MDKVLIISCGGHDNFGDEAMFNQLYKKLIKQGNDITVGYYHYDIKKTRERFKGVKFIKLLRLPAKYGKVSDYFLKIINIYYATKYDAIYFTGSGNYTSLYSDFINKTYLLTKAFANKSKYIEFRPQSVGPFFGNNKKLDEKKIKEMIELANKFYVRDYFSYEYVKKISNKVKLVNDDAWEISAIKPEGFNEESIKNKNLIGVSIRPFKNKEKELIHWFVRLVNEIKERGYTPFFIPICYNQDSLEYRDNYFLKMLLDTECIFLEDLIKINEMKPENIKYFIKECDKCIGLSYHFNVFSISQNKEIISLYYEDYYKVKNWGLQKAFGDENKVINPFTTEVEDVIKLLEI